MSERSLRSEVGSPIRRRKFSPWAVERSLELIRNEGLTTLWFKLLGETVYRRMVLLERSLDAPQELLAAEIPVEFDLLRASDADEYALLRPDTGATEVRRRLELGQLCFSGRHDGRI